MMKRFLWMLGLAAVVVGTVRTQAQGFRTWDNKRDSTTPMDGNTGNNFQGWDNRADSRGGAVPGAVFVGTVESVDVTNRQLQVWGQESLIVRTGQVYDPKTRRVTTAPVDNSGSNPTTNRVVRGLQAVTTVDMRTFEVGGFCRIEPESEGGTKLIKRGSLADLKEGQMVSVEFTRGIGDRWTALGIVPFATLNVTNQPALK
jgi:hypothetical protein